MEIGARICIINVNGNIDYTRKSIPKQEYSMTCEYHVTLPLSTFGEMPPDVPFNNRDYPRLPEE